MADLLAQFLNVIESVFSGMSRAVIHNSDYGSVEAARAAIDRHFADRNAFFRANLRRAGKKICARRTRRASSRHRITARTRNGASSGSEGVGGLVGSQVRARATSRAGHERRPDSSSWAELSRVGWRTQPATVTQIIVFITFVAIVIRKLGNWASRGLEIRSRDE